MPDTKLASWQREVERLLDEHLAQGDGDLVALSDALSQATDHVHVRGELARKAEEARASYRRWLVAESELYSAILIGWPPGHHTPVHDHDGLWGIELVLAGRLHVDEFETTDASVKAVRSIDLECDKAVVFENAAYAHACSNPSASSPALSLHIYGGALLAYDVFPGADTATRERKSTSTEPL